MGEHPSLNCVSERGPLKGDAELNAVQEGRTADTGALFGVFSSRLAPAWLGLPPLFLLQLFGHGSVADAPGYPAACRCGRVVAVQELRLACSVFLHLLSTF